MTSGFRAYAFKAGSRKPHLYTDEEKGKGSMKRSEDNIRALIDQEENKMADTRTKPAGSFDAWMDEVNEIIRDACGMSADDLADIDYHDLWSDFASPREAAREALAGEGFTLGDPE